MKLPPEQEAIWAKCFHPSGMFVEFPIEDVETSIPARFEKIVRMYPDRLAVKMGDHRLTYDQLNQSANRIAGAILHKCAPGSEAIALLFGHGIELIAAILGTLKAGKFYVAIDPQFPPSRIGLILEDCQSRLIVTDSLNCDLAATFTTHGRTLLNSDNLDTTASASVFGSAAPSDPAGIMYTAGSTGTPKGVVKSHRHWLETTRLNSCALEIRVEDRLTLLHSPAFAAAEAMFHSSLLNGAALFPFDVKTAGIEVLIRWLVSEDITVLHTTPALFRQLADALRGTPAPQCLRLIRLTGALMTAADFELYKNTFAAHTLLQPGMGSTETGQLCSGIVDHGFSFPEQGSPIGYPYERKDVTLVDDDGREVGPGELGEIVVRSRYLASGYWRNAELTSAKFLLDAGGGDERTYRTGDLARRLPDGFLIHMGRKDSITKIRGYRVSLDEVETAMMECPAVQEAAAVTWDSTSGEKYLAAYVVPTASQSPSASGLRAFLKAKLPDYMIPTRVIFLDRLPQTGGKVDRKSLADPGNARPKLDSAFVAPRSSIEKELSRIWSEILGIGTVGIYDNFLDLGGHSLAATRVLTRVIQSFQLELPVKAVFNAPTVAEMALIITANQSTRASDAGLAQMLRDVEGMTEEDALRHLDEINSTIAKN